MRMSYTSMAIIAVSFFVASCTTTGQSTTRIASNFIHRQHITATQSYPPKNPQTVTLYTNNMTPHAAYRVIGVAKVSKFNLLGMQRKESTMQVMMRKLAASIGGDGVIDITKEPDAIKANVIQFQKILL